MLRLVKLQCLPRQLPHERRLQMPREILMMLGPVRRHSKQSMSTPAHQNESIQCGLENPARLPPLPSGSLDLEGREGDSRTESEQGVVSAVPGKVTNVQSPEGQRSEWSKERETHERSQNTSPKHDRTQVRSQDVQRWSVTTRVPSRSPSKTQARRGACVNAQRSQNRETAPRVSLTSRSMQDEACWGVPTDHEARRREKGGSWRAAGQKKEAADELQNNRRVFEGLSTRWDAHPEAEWAQELAKTVTSTIAESVHLATNTGPFALRAVAETWPSPRVTGSTSLGRRQLLVMRRTSWEWSRRRPKQWLLRRCVAFPRGQQESKGDADTPADDELDHQHQRRQKERTRRRRQKDRLRSVVKSMPKAKKARESNSVQDEDWRGCQSDAVPRPAQQEAPHRQWEVHVSLEGQT